MTVIYRHRKTADTIQIHGSLKQLIQIVSDLTNRQKTCGKVSKMLGKRFHIINRLNLCEDKQAKDYTKDEEIYRQQINE